jgi:ABC-2 type transport system permease protein
VIRRIAHIAAKEARHIVRDFRTVYLALGIPLVLLLLFGYALTMDIADIPTAVVDSDKSAASRDLASAFERTRFFSIVARVEDLAEIDAMFVRGEAKVAIVIPRGLGRALARGERVHVQLLADGTDANTAAIAIGYSAAIAQRRTMELASGALAALGASGGRAPRIAIDVRSRNRFNPTLKSQWYMVPGLIALIMAMLSGLLMSLTVAREWERGTMEQLLATPVRPLEIVVGKLLPYFAIGLLQLALITAAGVALFDVPLRGGLAPLFAVSSLFLVGSLGQGLLVSIATRKQQLAMQIAILTSMLPSLLLSGFMSPIASMPILIQHLSRIVPARYFLVVLRGLFLKGSSLSSMWPEIAALAIFATVMLGACAALFKTRIDA